MAPRLGEHTFETMLKINLFRPAHITALGGQKLVEISDGEPADCVSHMRAVAPPHPKPLSQPLVYQFSSISLPEIC